MSRKRETERARRLRRDAPVAETRLWRALRGYRLDGLKFRRQHPIDGYVVDFACVSARLVVEVDGTVHRLDEQITYDWLRTEDLKRRGWSVLRFTNEKVLTDLPSVLAEISRAANADAGHPHIPRARTSAA